MKSIECKNGETLTEREVERRVRWLMKYEGMTRREAVKLVKHTDHVWIEDE